MLNQEEIKGKAKQVKGTIKSEENNMGSNNQNQPRPLNPIGAATACATSDGDQTMADKVSHAAHAVREQVEERGAEIIDRVKQKVSDVYDQANKNVTEQYGKAVDYGRENPGKTTLLAFGVGVGVGLLLLGSFSTLRSRVTS